MVAHVNYLYFLSTQSFIYFYLSHLRRFRPICLTRAPESPAVRSDISPSLARSFYLYGAADEADHAGGRLWSYGLRLRRLLTRLPPRLAGPALEALHRWAVPRLRWDTDPARYLEWAGAILRHERACIIHAYFGPVGWRMLDLKRQLRLPLVVTFLGDDIAPTLEPWWWWFVQSGSEKPNWVERLRQLLAEGDLFLVEGPFLRQRLIDMGCAPDKVAVQRIALPLADLPRVEPRPPRADGKRVVLFAGRFCERKGILDALDAVARLWAERRDLEFRIIGDDTLTDGSYASRVYAAIRAHRLQGCVRLLGFLDHAQYLRELAEADIFLHPSIVDAEGLTEGGAPTTILEAQALGIPVVATLHCDIPNVTLAGESALLVPERDTAALAEALRQLLDDPERRARMGRAGRDFVRERHDVAREAPALEERYAALLERDAQSAP